MEFRLRRLGFREFFLQNNNHQEVNKMSKFHGIKYIYKIYISLLYIYLLFISIYLFIIIIIYLFIIII